MENQDELLEKKIPGEENETVEETESVDAETGTAEGGQEAATEDTVVEENVDNNVTEENPVEDAGEGEPEPEPEAEQEKMLPQSQVNELVGKARAEGRAAGKAEALQELYDRYGVNDDNEMNDIFGKGQGYDLLNDEYETVNGNFKNVSAENALLKSGVVATRWDDVKAILGSKGLDITVENIQSEMSTHPEWQNIAPAQAAEQGKEFTPAMGEQFAESAGKGKAPEPVKPGTIRKFGSNVPESKEGLEEADIKKLFGV